VGAPADRSLTPEFNETVRRLFALALAEIRRYSILQLENESRAPAAASADGQSFDLDTPSSKETEMRMKRLLVAVTLLLFVVGLAGCAKQPATNDPGDGTSGDTNRTIVEVDAKKVEELLQTDRDLVIIDVSGKWADGHIVGALDTPLDKLQEIINGNFTLSASKHYVVYAHDEETSKNAANMMLKSSFTVINRLVGGYDAWVANDGYTEK
jgi:rhodanese-related sulfurtransferase